MEFNKPYPENQNINLSLTLKEKKVLEFVEDYIKKEGMAPTFAEIKEFFNFASFNSVQRYLSQLCRKGYVYIPGGNQKRAIQILKSSDSLIDHFNNLKSNKSLIPFVGSSPKREISMLKSFDTQRPASESLSLPLLGKVAAGLPLESRNFNEFVEVPPQLVTQPQNSYVLKVVGTSMIEEGILDGDLIIIEDTREARNGELIVATVEDEATVKRIYFHKKSTDENHQVELRPSNPNMNSIWVEPVKLNIKGRVVGLIRKF
jgi:repressor LexA